jgi:hypothetical protein
LSKLLSDCDSYKGDELDAFWSKFLFPFDTAIAATPSQAYVPVEVKDPLNLSTINQNDAYYYGKSFIHGKVYVEFEGKDITPLWKNTFILKQVQEGDLNDPL